MAGVDLESFERTLESCVCRSRYDPEAMSASMAVIATLSELTEQCPTEVKPLQDAVDTDALDEVFQNPSSSIGEMSVTFSVRNYVVTVSSPDCITISKSEGNPSTVLDEGDTQR